jgi:serine/threonine protein phosphatase PrpC
LFGVFDGAGGEGNGDVASRFVAETMANYGNYYAINSAEDLANVTRMAQQEMAQKNIPGMTTAVVTKLLRKADGVYAAYVSLGDSRFYVVHNDGTADLITQDEGIENQIWNCLSSGRGYAGVNQFGEVKLKRGDKIVLCSDGITGDKGSDLMSNDEVASIVSRSANSEDASRNLVAGARKVDDRTALVIGEFDQ